MKIIGLTGSIATGKTTAAQMCRRLGLAVFDADACVHQLLGPGGAAVAAVAGLFDLKLMPGKGIDRQRLGEKIFADPSARHDLEDILHPLVARQRDLFLARQRRRRARFVVLDTPLLFETGSDQLCDLVICVWAPLRVQAARALARPGMSRAKFEGILAAQLPQSTKKRLADLALPSALGYAESYRRLRRWYCRNRNNGRSGYIR